MSVTLPITIDPGRIRQFGDPEGADLCLVTNASLEDHVQIQTDALYSAIRIVIIEADETFDDVLLNRVPEHAHVLVISPDRFFESPTEDVLGPKRKLLAMACNSTPTDLRSIHHFLGAITATDPQAQDRFGEKFFDLLESAEYLRIVHPRGATELQFDHLRSDIEFEWNQQGGSLDWGAQQIVPSGEISVLPVEIHSFDTTLHLPLQGHLTLTGYPILHSGTPSFDRSDQARLHSDLDVMRDHPVIATVEAGKVTQLRPAAGASRTAVEALEAMFYVDSRYRIIWEIGFGHNESVDILPGNHAMNEVYGGQNGCLHWGLGLTPYTQYHLDIIAPGTQVLTHDGRIVLG